MFAARVWLIPLSLLMVGSACAGSPPPRYAQADVDCIDYWPEARSSDHGYDHIVHIYNDCGMTAACAVTTSVNPNPIQVEVPPGLEVEVLTFRGSSSPEFRPYVQCTLTTSASGALALTPRARAPAAPSPHE